MAFQHAVCFPFLPDHLPSFSLVAHAGACIPKFGLAVALWQHNWSNIPSGTLCLRISWEGSGGCGEFLRKFHADIGVDSMEGGDYGSRCARAVLRGQ